MTSVIIGAHMKIYVQRRATGSYYVSDDDNVGPFCERTKVFLDEEIALQDIASWSIYPENWVVEELEV